MLVRLFKSQRTFSLLILLILAFGIRLPYLFSNEPIPVFYYTEPFSSYLFGQFPGFWTDKLWNTILTTLMYFSLGLWLSIIINRYNLLPKNSYMPALLFVLVTGIFPTFYTIDAAILIIFIQLGLFAILLRLFKTHKAAQLCYNAGILVAIASLLYLPAIAWIFLIWITLLLLRPFNWREWISALAGVITPYIFVAFYYFWVNRWDDFLMVWAPLKGNFWQINVFPRKSDFLPLLPILFILVVAFNRLFSNLYKNVLLVRQAQQILVMSMLITAFSYYIKPSFSINHFILLAAPMSFFLSYYFLVARRNWIAESLMWWLIASDILFQII